MPPSACEIAFAHLELELAKLKLKSRQLHPHGEITTDQSQEDALALFNQFMSKATKREPKLDMLVDAYDAVLL